MNQLQAFFMWCSLINLGLLFVIFFVLLFAKEWAYKTHSKWFDISKREFDLIFYCFLGIYKLLIFVFCLIPWIATGLIR